MQNRKNQNNTTTLSRLAAEVECKTLKSLNFLSCPFPANTYFPLTHPFA